MTDVSLSKHEILYVRDSLKDFEEGRYVTISVGVSDKEFLRKLEED